MSVLEELYVLDSDASGIDRTIDSPVQAPPFESMSFPGWVYKKPINCVRDGSLVRLNRLRPKSIVAEYKRIFADPLRDECGRAYLKSLFRHNNLGMEHFCALEALIRPHMEKNIDVVCELILRDPKYWAVLPISIRHLPDVTLGLMYHFSLPPHTNGIDFPHSLFPWQHFTSRSFFHAFLDTCSGPTPPSMLRQFADYLDKMLARCPGIEEWFGNVFLTLMDRAGKKNRIHYPYLTYEDDVLALFSMLDKATTLANSDENTGRYTWLRTLRYHGTLVALRYTTTNAHVVDLLELNKDLVFAVPLACQVARHRPSQFAACLVECGSNADLMQQVMDVLLCPSSCPGPDLSIYLNLDLNLAMNLDSTLTRRRNYNLFDMLDGFTETTPGLADGLNWFHNWTSTASEEETMQLFDRFVLPDTSHTADRPISPEGCIALLPQAWRETTCYVIKLMEMDRRVLTGVVLGFDRENTSIMVDGHATDGTCALWSRYSTLTHSALPMFSMMMKAAFRAPVFVDSTGIPGENAIVFAYSIAAHCDSVAVCKKIIFTNLHRNIRTGIVLSLLPTQLHATLMQDRPFLIELAQKLPFEIALLPLPLRYDIELIKLAIKKTPDVVKWFDDPSRLLANCDVIDILLGSDRLVGWSFDHLSEPEKNNPKLCCSILNDERLRVNTRRVVYNSHFPAIVKHDRRCKVLACKFFGPEILSNQAEEISLNDPLSTRLLKIAHDSRSESDGANRRSNSAYLRSLLIDLREKFTPYELGDKDIIVGKGRTYESTLGDWTPSWNNTDMRFCEFEAPTSYAVYQKMRGVYDFLENVCNLVSTVLEPRRRDGGEYPAHFYGEKFDGVKVEFTHKLATGPDGELHLDAMPTLVTKCGGKPVALPNEWKVQLEEGFRQGFVPPFWGILHAGYGQRTKAMKLKNGTLHGDAEWEGVSIKVYQTFDHEVEKPTCFFPLMLSACYSFLHEVEIHYFNGYNPSARDEAAMIKLHRASVEKCGAGVVFLDPRDKAVFKTFDAPGYTSYAQKIAEFLHEYPLCILSPYMMAVDMMDESDDPENTEYPDIGKLFTKFVNEQTPAKKRNVVLTAPAKKKQKRVEAPAAAPSTSYWANSDDSASEVSDWGDISEVDD